MNLHVLTNIAEDMNTPNPNGSPHPLKLLKGHNEGAIMIDSNYRIWISFYSHKSCVFMETTAQSGLRWCSHAVALWIPRRHNSFEDGLHKHLNAGLNNPYSNHPSTARGVLLIHCPCRLAWCRIICNEGSFWEGISGTLEKYSAHSTYIWRRACDIPRRY